MMDPLFDTSTMADTLANSDSSNPVATTPKIDIPALAYPEEWRVYHYKDGTYFSMNNVTHLKVSLESGNHRIRCADGHMYIVAPGWKYIEFKAKDWSL